MIIESLILTYIIDTVSIKITNNNYVDHNTRWFFIHFVVNFIVTISNYDELLYCLKNIDGCTNDNISTKAYLATELVMVSHVYHMIFFYDYLKKEDWIHHISMCIFNGFVFYYQHKKIQAVAAFFCSGLPGMFDYFLLYLVKIKLLDKQYEKIIYLYLSTYIRSPGCVLTTLLSIPYFLREQIVFDYILSFISISLIFWNGQHYMAKTCIDYGRKIR